MTQKNTKINQCLGAGVGLRQEIKKDILELAQEIDFIEIIPERYFINKQCLKELKMLAEIFTVIPHGVGLSIGSPTLDIHHLKNIAKICEITECPYFSEHLCMTRSPGTDLGHLCPILFNEESLKTVIKNVQIVQETLKIPLVLENITYNFEQPLQTMSQEAFFRRLIETTGCKILLDVTNIHTNSYNHPEFNGHQFIDNLPIDAIEQFHVAGGYYTQENELIDGHNSPVEIESWELLEYCVQEKKVRKGVILEHDDDFPDDFTQLLKQLKIARKILNGQDWRSDLQLEISGA